MPKRPGVYGPYEHRRQFRIHVVDDRGKTNYFAYTTEKEARDVMRDLRQEIARTQAKTVGEAIDAYEIYLRDDKGNKASSYGTTLARLRAFFPDQELPVTALTGLKCAAYYEALTARIQNGKRMAVDTHRNMLAEARTFLVWCVTKRKWLSKNPFDGLEGKGRRRHGKPQLRIDEARKWLATAIKLAQEGESGAVAAMVSLLMGLRSGEIVVRQVRDLDDEGRLLWVPDSKTEAGKRTQEVPGLLRPFLVELAEARGGFEPLFPAERAAFHYRDWPRKWVQRICNKAGVVKVTAHGMRGLHGTLSISRGVTGHVVAAALGHECQWPSDSVGI